MRKILLVNILVLVGLVSLFDIAMYYMLPTQLAYGFDGFGHNALSTDERRETTFKDYYETHPDRGFDIKKNAKGIHAVDGIRYPIWSNSLGCFDVEHENYDEYVYFAGDSFTWGFTSFDEKFGTVIERSSGKKVLKCGVTHTGQSHQYDKFVDIVDSVKSLPSAVFVFFCWNDIINDYAHPHSTTIDGWQINTLSIRPDYSLQAYPHNELQERIDAKMQPTVTQQTSTTGSLKRLLRHYSLSANIVVALVDRFTEDSASEAAAIWHPLTFYYPTEEVDGKYWYDSNPKSARNKAALLRFRNFSQENEVPLHVILIPPEPANNFDSRWYEELRSFLRDNDIDFLDLTQNFEKHGYVPDDLYWRYDQHFNPQGNKAVADALAEHYPQYFAATGR